MTAATLTNVQSAVTVRFDRTAETIKLNVEEAKTAALEAGRIAAVETKQQANQLALSLTMLLPLVIILALVMAAMHVNVFAIVRGLPMVGLAVVAYAALNLFNPGASRN